MATQNSNAGKQMKSVESKSVEPKREAAAPAPAAPERATIVIDAVAETAAPEPTVAEVQRVETVREPAPVESSSAVAVLPAPTIVESVDSQEFFAAFDFDATLWSKKYFELWSENAQAFLDLAEQVAKAKTFEEAVAFQSRFAGERFEAFLRQSQELMSLAQRVANISAAPLRGSRAA